jgi:hypothetical protein
LLVPFEEQLFNCNRQLPETVVVERTPSLFDKVHAITVDSQPSVCHANQPNFIPARVIQPNDIMLESTEFKKQIKKSRMFDYDHLVKNTSKMLREKLRILGKPISGNKDELVARYQMAQKDVEVETNRNLIVITNTNQVEKKNVKTGSKRKISLITNIKQENQMTAEVNNDKTSTLVTYV